MNSLNQFLEYLSLISLGVTVISAFRMLTFLNARGKEKSAIYSFNPAFFLDYIAVTKEETGKIGIWFKVCCIALVVTAISGISSEVIAFLSRQNSP